MANMQENRSAFEDQWKEAFEDAEVTPSEGIWKNIDNELTVQENGKYRRGFIFYRSLAAACVVCLLGLGYYVLQENLQDGTNMLGSQTENSQLKDESGSLPEATDQNTNSQAEANSITKPDATAAQNNNEELDKSSGSLALQQREAASATRSGNSAGGIGNGNELAGGVQNEAQPDQSALVNNNETNTSEMPRSESAIFNVLSPGYLSALGPNTEQEAIGADWIGGIDRLYRVPQVIVDKKKEDEQQPSGLFAGVNMATNYFDPNFSQGGGSSVFNAAADESMEAMVYQLSQSPLAMDNYSTQASNSGIENRPQLSISYGIDVGMMLSKHLSLESGIDYGRMNSSTSTRLVAENFSQGERIPLLVSNAREIQSSGTRAQFTPQAQQLTNSFDIISVPMKLGYNIQFYRINIVLSSGVAANFFLNNRLSDDNGQLNTVNVGASSDSSPFRPLYYSAVFSGGINYKLTENYALSVAPNYNLALSDLTESGYNFSSQPNNFGVDFGIRYVFQ